MEGIAGSSGVVYVQAAGIFLPKQKGPSDESPFLLKQLCFNDVSRLKSTLTLLSVKCNFLTFV